MEWCEEVREEGSVKPSEMSLARVSVVRGDGPLEEVPFIDHYICSKVPPTDYLTKFSGLRPGDLDPMSSKHWLTTKKSVYQKLRYLVDAGCKFVGHGLASDFRIINMFVPSHQIIDTVDLFRLPTKRLLALKFLAAQVLQTKIQTDTHDSVEDARTALRLYKRYLELKKAGSFEKELQRIYSVGQRTNWKCGLEAPFVDTDGISRMLKPENVSLTDPPKRIDDDDDSESQGDTSI
eukprot:GHVN01090450.1.p1 GENE.GHVN01090450.1~~GHVN01090450.1.p1  ORF type:complete len:235 (-),score=36.24 GHVN01090450.1:3530-4234(-)